MSAVGRRRHNEAAFQWQLAQFAVVAAGGKSVDFPDYEESEEDYDPEWIEAQLSRHPLVRRGD